MQTIKQIYEDLTSVNIESQREIWDERGKGYFGEYLVFCTLFNYLTDDSKILMNIEIPVEGTNKTTEIDMILIHETGLYCFEMKHYKGDIYCNFNDERWVQAFRISKNNAFNNPIRQNKHHIDALKQFASSMPIYSFVIFTNDMVTLHNGKHEIFDYKNIDDSTVCTLEWLNRNVKELFDKRENINSTEMINDTFIKLEPYSKIKEKVIIDKEKVISFAEFMNSFHSVYNNKVKRIQDEAEASIKESHKIRNVAIAFALVGILIAILGVTILPQKRIDQIENKYSNFFLKFEEVNNSTIIDDIHTTDIARIEDFSMQETVNNAYCIKLKVIGTNSEYGIALNDLSRLIVQYKDGSIKEVDIFSDSLEEGMILRNNAWLQTAFNGSFINIKSVNVPNMNISDMKYIKLINLSLIKNGVVSKPIKKDLELEVKNYND